MEQRKKIIITPTSLNEKESYVTCFAQIEEGILEISVNDGEVVIFKLKNEKGFKNFVNCILDAWQISAREGLK